MTQSVVSGPLSVAFFGHFALRRAKEAQRKAMGHQLAAVHICTTGQSTSCVLVFFAQIYCLLDLASIFMCMFVALGLNLLLGFPGWAVLPMPGHNFAKISFWVFPGIITQGTIVADLAQRPLKAIHDLFSPMCSKH